uniref:Uncharacterized protein n=1 Tax=Rhipicephalus zambeziensis TaxID=60191 RepID=A0A224Y5I7_9ACAR
MLSFSRFASLLRSASFSSTKWLSCLRAAGTRFSGMPWRCSLRLPHHFQLPRCQWSLCRQIWKSWTVLPLQGAVFQLLLRPNSENKVFYEKRILLMALNVNPCTRIHSKATANVHHGILFPWATIWWRCCLPWNQIHVVYMDVLPP